MLASIPVGEALSEDDKITIREYFERELDSRDKLNDQRHEEFREAVAIMRNSLGRAEYEAKHESVIQRVASLERSVWMGLGAVALLAFIVPILAHFFFK